MHHRTVLIIDDCGEEREVFCRYMEFVGARVLEASNGEDGIRAAQEHLPDVILLDLSMPVLDGWRTLARLREDPATEGIPVMALTARHFESEEELEAAGFCAYLEKPIGLHRVLEEVERCIGRVDTPWADPGEASAPEKPPATAPEAEFPPALARTPSRRARSPTGRWQG